MKIVKVKSKKNEVEDLTDYKPLEKIDASSPQCRSTTLLFVKSGDLPKNTIIPPLVKGMDQEFVFEQVENVMTLIVNSLFPRIVKQINFEKKRMDINRIYHQEDCEFLDEIKDLIFSYCNKRVRFLRNWNFVEDEEE